MNERHSNSFRESLKGRGLGQSSKVLNFLALSVVNDDGGTSPQPPALIGGLVNIRKNSNVARHYKVLFTKSLKVRSKKEVLYGYMKSIKRSGKIKKRYKKKETTQLGKRKSSLTHFEVFSIIFFTYYNKIQDESQLV